MKIKIFTRSMNEELYQMASSFWPEEIEKERCTQFNYWEGALDFLYHVLESDCDIAIVIDEDCFIFDWDVLDHAIKRMEMVFPMTEIIGMPDTIENCHHRVGPDYSLNPFLLVFNLTQIKMALNLTSKLKIKLDAPESNEIFYPLFYWLNNHFSVEKFQGKDHLDNISTILEGEYFGKKKPFALHSWYSREFETVPEQKQRILNLYNEAKSLKQ
jgi:hypothetical protein